MTVQIKGARELGNKFTKLQRGVPKAGENAVRRSLKRGKRMATSLAPSKKGALKAGIKRKTITKQGNIISGTLSSSVPGAFPYNLWVNRSPGFRTIRGRWPFFLSRGKILYGGSARSPSRKPINWTGTPGYFDLTVKFMEEKYPKMAIEELNNVMKRSGF